jgi:hypothetical protein
VVAAPGGLVGEVAQEADAHVVVPGCVGVVQAGDPVLAGLGVAAQVESVPGDGLGQGGRQGVQTQPEGVCVATVFEQLGHRGQVGIQQRGGVLWPLGGVTGELLGGVLQERDEVLADWFAVAGLGERARRASDPVRGQRRQGGAGDREKVWRSIAVRRASLSTRTPHGTGLGTFRWVVERTISWLHGFRRLRIRWEKRDDIHEAFLGLALCLITHRHVQHVQRLC